MWRRWAMTALFAGGVFLYFKEYPNALDQLAGAAGGEGGVPREMVGGTVSAAFAALLNFLLPSREVIVLDRAMAGAPETRPEHGADSAVPAGAPDHGNELTERRRDVIAMRLALACALCLAFASFVATVSVPPVPELGAASTAVLPEASGRAHGMALVVAYFAVAAVFGLLARWSFGSGLLRAFRLGGISALCVNLSALLIALPYRMNDQLAEPVRQLHQSIELALIQTPEATRSVLDNVKEAADALQVRELPLEMITWARLAVLPIVAAIGCLVGTWIAAKIWRRAVG